MNVESFKDTIRITQHEFGEQIITELEKNAYVRDFWPLIYILRSDKHSEAYVGESANALSRLRHHLLKEERRKLEFLDIITSDKFNKSAALDIEAHLISYMSGDGRYVLQNGNAGIANHNYYQKDRYREAFQDIWTQLQRGNIVDQNLQEINNSDLFKYSPYKALTRDQHDCVLQIISSLSRESNHSIVVNGSAGTGKTILAIFLIKLLTSDLDNLLEDEESEYNYGVESLTLLKEKFNNPQNIAMVVPMVSLRNTLKSVFKQIGGLKSSMVISPTDASKKKYDLLLVDEAHRLRRRRNLTNYSSFDKANLRLGFSSDDGTELAWIMKQSEQQIFFYDPDQSIRPSDVREVDFAKIIEDAKHIELHSQLRVKGGNGYIDYVNKLLNAKFVKPENRYQNKNYELKLFDSLSTMIDELHQREEEHGLCRLVAGYAWEWKSKKDISAFDIEIEDCKLRWNSEAHEWINSDNALQEVGCIHTTQGYDLNYVAIIFGSEITYDPVEDRILVRKENYRDKKGYFGIQDDEELKKYIINIYKTLMYRGIRGTYVYVCDEQLRDYFRQYLSTHQVPSTLPFQFINNQTTKPLKNAVPLYDISIAAGAFSELQEAGAIRWVKLPDQYRIHSDHFICQVLGESMNRIIPSGTWCLFSKYAGGSREGKIVLVQHRKIEDPAFGAGYTIKKYHSDKQFSETEWSHQKITLQAFSTEPEYEDLIFTDAEIGELKVIGIFEKVIVGRF